MFRGALAAVAPRPCPALAWCLPVAHSGSHRSLPSPGVKEPQAGPSWRRGSEEGQWNADRRTSKGGTKAPAIPRGSWLLREGREPWNALTRPENRGMGEPEASGKKEDPRRGTGLGRPRKAGLEGRAAEEGKEVGAAEGGEGAGERSRAGPGALVWDRQSPRRHCLCRGPCLSRNPGSLNGPGIYPGSS